jgi:LCP family protein required for cell wall assembly
MVAPRRRRRRWGRAVGLALLAVVLVATIFSGLGARRLYAFGQAISPQAPLSSQTGFMSGGQRVNIVVMGYGGTGHDGAYLTDSLMVISMVPSTGSTTLISVPRDLWVQVPPGSGVYAKINTAYQDGLYNGFAGLAAGKLAGGALAAQKVGDVTGLDVKYWVTIDFTGFRKLVDALGGVDITVPTAFTANYPINDDPAINAGWKTIHFNAGPQHMSGEQAIEYARARYVTDPAREGTDFARSARQQLLMRAIMSRARQMSAWPGLAGGLNALQNAMYTNLSLADLGLLAQKMNLSNAHRVGLSNQNVLTGGVSNDGQDILLPQNGDWSAVRDYVAQQLAP